MPWMLGPGGERVDVLPQHVDLAKSKGYELESGQSLPSVDPVTGLTMSAPAGEFGYVPGEALESSAGTRSREEMARKEREYGGPVTAITTGLESAASTVTAGGYDAAGRALFGEEFSTRRRESEEVQPVATVVGEVGGYAATLGAGAPGLVGKAIRLTPIGKAAAVSTNLAKSGKVATGMAIEGGVMGLGEGTRELMLSGDELTLERVANLAPGALLNAAAGFGIGSVAKAAGKGVRKARDLVAQKTAPVAAAPRAEGVISDASDDAFRLMDEFKAHQASDIDVIAVLHGPQKKAVVGVRGAGGRIDKLVDRGAGLAERPGAMLDPLRREAKALREVMADPALLLEKGALADAAALKQLSKHTPGAPVQGTLARAYADHFGISLTKAAAKKGIAVSAKNINAFREALSSGAAAAKRAATIKRIPELLESNEVLQRRVLDVLEAGKQKAPGKGFIENAVTGAAFTAGTGAAAAALPDEASFLAPLAGAAVAGKLSSLVFGRMAKAGQAAANRSAKAVDMFLDTSAVVARRSAMPLATKVLSEASFGDAPVDTGPKVKEANKGKLYEAYQARERELYNQVMMTPAGVALKPAAREKIYANLAGVRALSPELADKVESSAARKIQFLAEKIPKRPDSVAMRLGPDRWRPSDMAMREFARYVAAIEDPPGVLERVAHTTVTPEDAEVMREVFPLEYQDFQTQIAARLHELREELPYAKRLALSIFTGVPVDAAMDPRVLNILQGHFVEEQGGGNEAPKSSPQFGSISKPEPTPGQNRAG